MRKEQPTDKARKEFFDIIKILDDVLSDKEFIASNSTYSLADLSLISTFLFSFANEENFTAYPSLCRWIERMNKIPEYVQISGKALDSFRTYLRELKK